MKLAFHIQYNFPLGCAVLKTKKQNGFYAVCRQ